MNAILAGLWLHYPLEAQSGTTSEPLQPNVRTLPAHDWPPKKACPKGSHEFGVGAVDDYVDNLNAGLCHHLFLSFEDADRPVGNTVRPDCLRSMLLWVVNPQFVVR